MKYILKKYLAKLDCARPAVSLSSTYWENGLTSRQSVFVGGGSRLAESVNIIIKYMK